MLIFIQGSNLHSLEVEDQKVSYIKQYIENEEGISANEPILYHSGSPLNDDQLIAQCVPDNGRVDVSVGLKGGKVHGSLARAGKVKGQTPKNVLLDLLSESSETTFEAETSVPVVKSQADGPDLLDLLGGLELDPQVQNSYPPPTPNILMDHYVTSQSSTKSIPSITAFEKNGLKIIFEFDKPPDNPQMIIINLVATNYSVAPIQDFVSSSSPKSISIAVIASLK